MTGGRGPGRLDRHRRRRHHRLVAGRDDRQVVQRCGRRRVGRQLVERQLVEARRRGRRRHCCVGRGCVEHACIDRRGIDRRGIRSSRRGLGVASVAFVTTGAAGARAGGRLAPTTTAAGADQDDGRGDAGEVAGQVPQPGHADADGHGEHDERPRSGRDEVDRRRAVHHRDGSVVELVPLAGLHAVGPRQRQLPDAGEDVTEQPGEVVALLGGGVGAGDDHGAGRPVEQLPADRCETARLVRGRWRAATGPRHRHRAEHRQVGGPRRAGGLDHRPAQDEQQDEHAEPDDQPGCQPRRHRVGRGLQRLVPLDRRDGGAEDPERAHSRPGLVELEHEGRGGRVGDVRRLLPVAGVALDVHDQRVLLGHDRGELGDDVLGVAGGAELLADDLRDGAVVEDGLTEPRQRLEVGREVDGHHQRLGGVARLLVQLLERQQDADDGDAQQHQPGVAAHTPAQDRAGVGDRRAAAGQEGLGELGRPGRLAVPGDGHEPGLPCPRGLCLLAIGHGAALRTMVCPTFGPETVEVAASAAVVPGAAGVTCAASAVIG